jgi:DNA-binding CsgD family transcriptional regulator
MKSPAYKPPACVSPQAEAHPNGFVPEARSVQLTARQREVLMLLCEGLPNKLIGRRLNISGATVKVHIGHILRELGVGSRLQAVVAARRLSFRPLTGAATQDGHGLPYPAVRASDAG